MKKKYESLSFLQKKGLFKILIAMKFTLLLFLFTAAQVFGTVYSQATKLSINLQNVSIVDILGKIEDQSEFKFLYNDDLLDKKRDLKVNYNNKTVYEILDHVLTGTGSTYSVLENNLIVITPRDESAIRQGQVTGKVTSAGGEPLIGATVVVKGTTIGTVTDIDGNYKLDVVSGDAVLVFSFIGFVTQEITLNGKTRLDVVLKEATQGIDEVMVVGFGTQKKANITGAASSIEMDKVLGNRPITNPVMALQGAIPGLQITTSSGQPGSSGLSINIRGATTINGIGTPLVLLDNVPVSTEDINPQDVESVTVLKDAAASSIYGARAAFGVVLITTKKGKKDQPVKFNYSTTFSISRPEDIPDKASTYDFVNALNSWGTNPFWTGQDIPAWVNFLEEYKKNPDLFPEGYTELDGLRYPLVDTDVIGAFLNDQGFSQIHTLSFSGGGKNTSYRVSAGYSDEDGIIVTDNDSYTKYNLNVYLQSDLTDKLTATTNIIYNNDIRTLPIGNYNDAISFGPYTPADGNYVFEDGTEIPYDTPANRERLGVVPKRWRDKVRLFGKLDYTPVKGLTITGEYTFEKTNTDNVTGNNEVLTVNPERFTLNAVDPARTYYGKSNSKAVYGGVNIYAKYKKSIAGHNLSILAGFNNEKKDYEYLYAERTKLINVDLPSISTASGVLGADDNFFQWAVLGYFARLNFDYKEKYFLELNGRYDGSSRFSKDDRFGFFPSFSTGWNIARESFMEDVGFISQLKLRASWGEIGNQIVKNRNNVEQYYPYIPGMPAEEASWLDPNGKIPYVTLGMPELVSAGFTWETIQTINLGLDARLFDNRLSTSFDIFTRNTLGMLTEGAQIPAVLGADAPLQNAADLQTKGWEFELSWRDQIGGFSYNIGITVFDNHGEITKYGNDAGLLNDYYIGQKIGEIWGYVTDRYYTVDDFVEGSLDKNLMNGILKEGIPRFKGRSPNPGDILYKDLNGDSEIFSGNNTLADPGDRKVIGNTTRRYQYGVFGNISYKNFDFSFMLNGVGKRAIWSNTPVRFPYIGEFKVVYVSQLDYWTPENTDAYFPRNYALGGVNYGINRQIQTKYLIDGSYMRVKNITLGYSFPKRILTKAKIDRLRIFVAGENILDFNNYPDGINTELSDKGNGATYPYMKSYSVGLNLRF